MIEFDVDMSYLLECDELDKVVLNDENGEHEPMEFVPKDAATVCVGTCKRIYHPNRITKTCTCSNCGYGASDERWAYCPKCGHKYVHGEVEEWWKSVGRKVAE